MTINAATYQVIGDNTPIWEVGFQTSLDGVTPVVMATLDGTYSCRIGVQGTTIDREITVKTGDNKYFRAWLTPAETATLSGIVTVGIQISNASLVPPLVLEQQIVLHMQRGAVA